MNAREISLASALLLQMIGVRGRDKIKANCTTILHSRHMEASHHDAAALLRLLEITETTLTETETETKGSLS